MSLLAESEVVAQKIAAFGLPGGGSNGAISVDQDSWPNVLSLLQGRRITGFAVAALESERLELSDEQAAELLEAHRRAMLGPLVVERGLLELAPILDRAGVEFIVLKGPALAHTVYPDPSWRFFGDLDLMVRPQQWREASALLETVGYRRGLPDPRPRFVERFGGASAHRGPSGLEVDLHRTIVLGPFGLWVDTERLFDLTTEFRVGGRGFRRLDDTSLLLHACIHASLGSVPPLTTPVRDVAQVAHFAKVDWDAMAERSARWNLGCVVRHALEYASEALAVPSPPEARPIMAGSSRRRERRALQAYVGERRDRGGTALSTLSAIRGIRAKAAYVLGLLFPDRTFLAARMGGRASYLNRWKIPVRWLRRRDIMRRRRV
jgi:hypothetical protein